MGRKRKSAVQKSIAMKAKKQKLSTIENPVPCDVNIETSKDVKLSRRLTDFQENSILNVIAETEVNDEYLLIKIESLKLIIK